MVENTPHISKAQVKWVRSLQQKKVRDAEGVFVAEGDKCIGERMGAFELVLLVTNSEVHLHEVTYTESSTRSHLHEATYIASDLEIEQMSSLRTPQGCIAVFRKPHLNSSPTGDATKREAPNYPKRDAVASKQPELILALDSIQDPGNLGTIIRTCDWFGIRDIYCSRETADCYNPKVVQATMGALARVRIHYVNLVDWLQSIQRLAPLGANDSTIQQEAIGLPIYGTLLDGRNMYEPSAIPDRQNGIIIMGNEGNGISPEVRHFITHPLYIPSYNVNGTVESLNVSIATAIILSEFRRR